MYKFDTEYIKRLLTENDGDRAKVADILGVNKVTVAKWINKKFDLRHFRLNVNQRPKTISAAPANCDVTRKILENQLSKIRQSREYINADEKGRAEIEKRVRQLIFEAE